MSNSTKTSPSTASKSGLKGLKNRFLKYSKDHPWVFLALFLSGIVLCAVGLFLADTSFLLGSVFWVTGFGLHLFLIYHNDRKEISFENSEFNDKNGTTPRKNTQKTSPTSQLLNTELGSSMHSLPDGPPLSDKTIPQAQTPINASKATSVGAKDGGVANTQSFSS